MRSCDARWANHRPGPLPTLSDVAPLGRIRPKEGRRRGTHLDAAGTAQLRHGIGVRDRDASAFCLRDQVARYERLCIARDDDPLYPSPFEMLMSLAHPDGTSMCLSKYVHELRFRPKHTPLIYVPSGNLSIGALSSITLPDGPSPADPSRPCR